ncbi:phosphoribosylformylglycinamidine synthase subunit PurQ [Myxococcaceae bacterium GXIMD 01537]
MKVGIVCYPGSACNQDAMRAVRRLGHMPVPLYLDEHGLKGSEALILPGGLGGGETQRSGSLPRLSVLMEDVVAFAARGGPVLGICDGFQALIEAGLLPGLVMPGASRRLVSSLVELRVENTDSPFTRRFVQGEHIHVHLAHVDASYFLDARQLEQLEAAGRVAFRFVDGPQAVFHGIAGLLNEAGNVLGMMPHPERAMEPMLGGTDGLRLFESFLS